jgi:hypothetical protein
MSDPQPFANSDPPCGRKTPCGRIVDRDAVVV